MIRQGQLVIDKLAALRCVTVAAINGFALGGGLEVALACRYRVAADDPSVTLGFPEVQLGVHPGLGGTVRAVQLAGPIAAMDLMLTGRTIRPKQALQDGIGRQARAARATARSRAASGAQSAADENAVAEEPPAELLAWCGRSSPDRCARKWRVALVPITTLLRTS